MFGVVSLIFITSSVWNVQKIWCANILMAEDVGSPSHQLWNYAIADGLASRGHNVTILGLKSIPLEGHKFHFIEIEGLYSDYKWEAERWYQAGIYETIQLVNEYSIFACNHSLNSGGFRRLMNYPKDFKFDLVLFDVTFGSCFLPLIQRLNSPPSIGITALLLAPHLSEAFGSSYQSSYLPHIYSQFSHRMSILERLPNNFWFNIERLLKYFYYTPKTDEIARRAFGDDTLPLETLLGQVSLLFCNLSPGFHYPEPLPPTIIPVGGLHIKPAKKLPQNLQEIMDNAKNGVILLSLGTNVRSDGLKPEQKRALIDAFSKINQTVLWKFESQLTGLPENVIVRKWLPQTDLLGHPNLKLFITHGGGLSTIESAYFGTPVLGLPFFLDQHHNIEIMVNRKMGIKLEYRTMTGDELLSSIQELLQNPIYAEEAKKMSRIMNDQPETSLERAIFWAEYAMRHNGTHFLDPKSRHLSKFVSSSTDVHLLYIVLLCSLFYICSKIVSSLKLFLFENKQNKSKRE